MHLPTADIFVREIKKRLAIFESDQYNTFKNTSIFKLNDFVSKNYHLQGLMVYLFYGIDNLNEYYIIYDKKH